MSREVTFISSSGQITEEALAADWPGSPNTSFPKGAGRWPTWPKESSYGVGKPTFFNIRFLQLAPDVRVLPKQVLDKKYSGKGGYMAASFERFNLPNELVPLLVTTSNESLATSTWNKYRGLPCLVSRIETFFGGSYSFLSQTP